MAQTVTKAPQRAAKAPAKATVDILKTIEDAGIKSVFSQGEYIDPLIGLSFEKFFTNQPLIISLIMNQGDTSATNKQAIQDFIEGLENVNSTLYEVATLQPILMDIQNALEVMNKALN